MTHYEKLGLFYLGRPYDLVENRPKPGWLLYDSKDLVTHAVCVGMTGSGKTGLCVGLLEEAAIDGIPAIVIDPKGDLTNLMLTFPELRKEDFLPWINEDDARKKAVSPSDFAAEQAALWKSGLAQWGQDGARIARLREAADFAVYTPGSQAGIPVSILHSFAPPPQAILDDAELLGERIGTTATSLLGLLGIEADPIQSREHILISTILDCCWKQRQGLDLATLIQQIQTPPLNRIGVMDLETFYPSKDRFELAMRLNNLLAAPGFAAWLEGEALDIGRLLHTNEGKPRIAIFSIAHLSEAERMFFVTLLLSQTLGWMRTQPGTSTLRAILYMDEIFGFFPPVANPPSKRPLLTLLKQARAFGVGVVLATQNPVDLDYKGLANTGTWFIGRLQTERDKARVLEGLEGASASTGKKFDRSRMQEVLAGLGSRVFLMHNVHDEAPEIFETRWVLSYLRGPLTRVQIKTLMEPRRAAGGVSPGGGTAEKPGSLVASASTQEESRGRASIQNRLIQRPVLPPDVRQYFVPASGRQPPDTELVYQPTVFGSALVRVSSAKQGVEITRNLRLLAPITGGALAVDWSMARDAGMISSDLEPEPLEEARFTELPAEAGNAKSYRGWKKAFHDWLYRSQTVQLWKSQRFNEMSNPGESERDFRIRLQEIAHERRDRLVEQMRKKYAPKILRLQERIRRAEQAVEREQEQATHSKVQTAISIGATLLGAFLGRKAVSTSSLGKATTAVRGAGRSMKEAKDVKRAKENVEALQERLADLEAEFEDETEGLGASDAIPSEDLETVTLRPTKTNISVRLVALAWAPYWQDGRGIPTPAWGEGTKNSPGG